MNNGLNEELLGRVMAIKRLELLRGVVREVKIAPSVSYTVFPSKLLAARPYEIKEQR